jgi:hypothetical protein
LLKAYPRITIMLMMIITTTSPLNKHLLPWQWMLLLGVLVMVVGCTPATRTPVPLPTQADINALGTAMALTEVAPPEGYNNISVPRIDDKLLDVSGWRYTALMQFDGVFARTTRPANARVEADVAYHQVASAKRVVAQLQLLESSGEEDADTNQYEAVQLGEDVFLVRDGVCLADTEDDARVAISLSAGTLIGGVQNAPFAGQKAVINGVEVWAYDVALEQITLANVGLANADVLAFSGELWYAPAYDAVVRYYLTLELENATFFGSTLPVTGTLLVRYDVFDMGTPANISVPFGC